MAVCKYGIGWMKTKSFYSRRKTSGKASVGFIIIIPTGALLLKKRVPLNMNKYVYLLILLSCYRVKF